MSRQPCGRRKPDRFLRSSLRKNAQQKERAWERRRIYFAAAWEEIRQDGEFLDKK